ncbi:MAG: hypothetical protein ACR2M4_02680 [Actinomycetota bacterium]
MSGPEKRTASGRFTTASLFLALTLLAACGASAESEKDAPATPPAYYSSSLAVCRLVATNDLRVVTGYEYLEGVDRPTNALAGITGITKCVYEPKRRPRKFVTTGVVYAYAGQIYDDVLRARSGLSSLRVAGIGTNARWYPDAGELLVLSKGKLLGVNMRADFLESDAEIRERARRVAGIMLGRLR